MPFRVKLGGTLGGSDARGGCDDDVISRALHNAGAGQVGVPFHMWDCVNAADQFFYPVQFSNSNSDVAFTVPKTAFDTIATGVELPELEVGDMIYVPNIGAYSCASALTFNGIPPAKVLVI